MGKKNKSSDGTVERINGRIARYRCELNQLIKEGKADTWRACELELWIEQDKREIKRYII